ncbi:class I SAM-dependent methyltransferase [Tardisphaera miroshnichenkoae]
MKSGLGSLWFYLSRVYEQVPRVYDKGSDAISLWQVRRWRMEALKLPVRSGDLVLDAGSGKGAMSELLRRFGVDAIMLDASFNMLMQGTGDRVQGVFERLPFRKGVFDYVVMSFSLHASIDYGLALGNLRGSIKEGGRIFIVSIGKPSSRAKYALCLPYFGFVVPVLALLSTGKEFPLFLGLKIIYQNNPENDLVRRQLDRLFETLKFKEIALGVVFEYVGAVPVSRSHWRERPSHRNPWI